MALYIKTVTGPMLRCLLKAFVLGCPPCPKLSSERTGNQLELNKARQMCTETKEQADIRLKSHRQLLSLGTVPSLTAPFFERRVNLLSFEGSFAPQDHPQQGMLLTVLLQGCMGCRTCCPTCQAASGCAAGLLAVTPPPRPCPRHPHQLLQQLPAVAMAGQVPVGRALSHARYYSAAAAPRTCSALTCLLMPDPSLQLMLETIIIIIIISMIITINIIIFDFPADLNLDLPARSLC